MDNRVKTVLYLVAAVVVLIGIRVGVATARRQDDQTLIRASLAEAVKASKEGRPGGVMEYISDKLKINNSEPGTRSQIAKFIKDSRPDVEVEDTKAIITGDEARIVSPVRVKFDFLGQQFDRRLSKATLTFRREDATEYLVIPTTRWRLIDVQLPEESVYEFLQ